MARCVAVFVADEGEEASGFLTLEQSMEDAPTVIAGRIEGLTPGPHGLHIHVFGDLSSGMANVAGIFNPFGRNHGAPEDEERMAGDLGNITANEEGVAEVQIEDRQVKLIGPHSVIGRSIVLKAGEDDLGRGGHELSLADGNSGARVAGAVIGIAMS
uniref:superoxide dismutase n=1 Tax=Phaeomonas parva TaxID=124430 RepID=A0A7S1XLZ7_9STRA|mmetsp:Transcript_15134/g.45584  ORF Transcript_15134/g.45584 Transcript_15134/m.45584 type:complete len:157 (+) Transcript_15134:214-684(+)|eukprot:CAMPEP_0118875052 /NCGR_PEP_ID=MMETSP1163-20130328/16267_1 /TAXON_ID=124430 /ORGANISM="Phaeomonas parva, Strain CCMP2877" /LENGTH=156 /DNA_ID=CAMNT_0006810509 /DNA_START=125 /DNA_END=595 /DNA_ORIENTATION=+